MKPSPTPAYALPLAGLLLLAPPARAQDLRLITGGLTKPVDMAAIPAPDEKTPGINTPTLFYLVEQTGLIRVIENNTLLEEPFFEVNRADFTDRGWEQGLLGIALDPDYPENLTFYLNYTDRRGNTHVSRFKAESLYHADHESEEIVLEITQPASNHNGGCIRFGPDDLLYIGTGDGGSAGDPWGNAQNKDSLLGKLLRINVRDLPEGTTTYTVPDDNPFAQMDNAQPELWSIGLRNPWRFSFDSQGRIWIGDVGQNTFEFVHLQPTPAGGQNFGWNYMEGPERFSSRPRDQRGVVPPDDSLTKPVWSYRQADNNSARNGSITGGYLYEGARVDKLNDRYICADFMSGRFWSFHLENGRADDIVEHTRDFTPAFGDAGPALAVSSFGRDTEGELYVLDHKSGRLFKIVP